MLAAGFDDILAQERRSHPRPLPQTMPQAPTIFAARMPQRQRLPPQKCRNRQRLMPHEMREVSLILDGTLYV
jgi:hypothetical protein